MPEFSVLARGTFHIPAEYFSVITRVGKAGDTGGLCDALPRFQQGKTLLYTVVHYVFKQRHMHMLFEKAAAFTFTYADAAGNIFQCNIFIIVELYVRQNISQPSQGFRCLPLICGHCAVIAVELLPDSAQRNMDLKLIIRRRSFRQGIYMTDLVQYIALPVHLSAE